MKTITPILFVLFAAFCSSAQVPVPNVPPKLQSATINITLAWDASPSSNVTKTVVRRGNASGTYTEMVELPASQLTYTWPNADAFTSSFFVVTAKNAAGEESAYSNEVEYRPASGKLLPPVLKTPQKVTAKFKVTPPETIEQVDNDGTVRSKLWIFIDDGEGSQNIMLTTTEGSFRVADQLPWPKPEEK